MNLLMLLGLVCVCIGLSEAQEEGSNSTCPYPSCSCAGATLQCHGLTEFPILPSPNQFTAFVFYGCDIEAPLKLPSAYSNATELVVTDCGLSSVADDAFEFLGGLETLELRGNRLTNVSKISLSPLRSLVKLDLSYNRLSTLPDELFKDLPKLRELDLGGNLQMEFTENLFGGAVALKTLSCNDCRLKNVPTKSLANIKKLEHLELNENPFQSIDDKTFKGLQQQILELSLDNCSLTAISTKALQPFSSLRLLNIGHNQLQSIPVEAFRNCWSSLKVLYLESNLLKTLDHNLAPWHDLEELKLVNNPWHCDYHLAWIKNISIDIFHKENVTCVTPPELQGQSIRMTCPENHSSAEGHSSSTKYLLIGFGITALVLGVTVTLWCVISRLRRRYRGTEIKYSQVYGETVSTVDSKQSLVFT